MAQTRYGTFGELLELTPDHVRPIVQRLHDTILSLHPDAVIVVRLGDKAATFGLGPKRMSEGYCAILPYAHRVNLAFFQGASLPDPDGLLEGTGAKMRHIKLDSVQACDAPAVTRMVGAALAERRAALGLG